MNKHQATCKCLLCGTECTLGNPVPMTEDEVSSMLARVLQGQLHEIPLYVKHACDDGSISLAEFAGFRRLR